MDLLTRKQLMELIEPKQGPCVSMYIPATRKGPQTRENRIRFKNILSRAESNLQTFGLKAAEAAEFMKPVDVLLRDNEFWQHQSDGLAVFISPGMSRFYRLPQVFSDKAVILDNRFYVKPLLPVFSGDGRFMILAISQNKVRLMQGTRYSISELDLEDVPSSLSELLRTDLPQKQLQFHTGGKGGAGRQSVIFHGHGVGTDDTKTEIRRYFQAVDRGLTEFFNDDNSPLVIASVEYLQPIYKDINTYGNLIDQGVYGNPDNLSPEKLHEKAWQVVEPLFKKSRDMKLEAFTEYENAGLASRDLKTIVIAACSSRIDTMFFKQNSEVWGFWDSKSFSVTIKDKPGPDAEDLIDLAAVETLNSGGTVYPFDDEQLGGDTIGAIFRY
ncbi:hypothetical protein JW979_12330 [bacterium]|nr:hypothetical protein [candidate division CSSED10-310 bacterium]